ncbi:Filamentous growth regulator [Paramyrothecium foliicola]|nr:Filamentous growth regulator [Paramyrothecium foliicola]
MQRSRNNNTGNNQGAVGAGRQSWSSVSQASANSAQDTITAALPSPSNVMAMGTLPDEDMGGTADLFRPLSPSESREENEETGSYRAPGSATSAKVSRKAAPKDSALVANGPRMLLSSHGERVYIGGAASIAFLQTVRRVVAGQIGPSDFSQNKESESMLEIETPQSTEDAMEIGVEQKLQFLQCYFSVTEAFIDIFDPPELEACVATSGNGPLVLRDNSKATDGASPSACLSPLRRASLDLVIAIGAQCTSEQDSQSIGRAFFRGAQRQALSEMIQDPDLDMVRTYLLMAFYMLGECRRNTAYMYLSVAARAAIALGLHSPSSYSDKQPLDANDKLRLRVWMTCRVGDKLVNGILGRPAATVGISEELGPIFKNLVSGCDHGLNCMVAAYRIVSIIDDINNKLYYEQDVRPAVVERLLQDIDAWKRDLPPSLKQSPPAGAFGPLDVSSEAKKGSVGTVHISCLYYFAVTLATRPMFITSLTAQQGPNEQQSPLAEACLDAAMYLAQTCVEALTAGLLQSNMCIMKALVFAAGLVLGVESFAKVGANYEIERAFEGSKQVLGFLATRSPQASHYLDILNSLSNAIQKQRSRMSSGRASRYVSKLFSLGSSSSSEGPLSDRSKNDISWSNMLLDETAMDAIPNLPALPDDPAKWPDAAQLDPEMYIDWETVNISHWDNFPFRV